MFIVEREVQRSARFTAQLNAIDNEAATRLVAVYERYLRRGWVPPTETTMPAASDGRPLYLVHTEKAFVCPPLTILLEIPQADAPIVLHAVRLRTRPGALS